MTGLEPATSGVTGRRSDQLSYTRSGVRAGDITGSFGLRKRCFFGRRRFLHFAALFHYNRTAILIVEIVMGEIVNLNRWRKTKAKEDKARQAEVNRVAFGRTKAEKDAERKRADQIARELDGKRFDDDGDTPA